MRDNRNLLLKSVLDVKLYNIIWRYNVHVVNQSAGKQSKKDITNTSNSEINIVN